MEEKNRINKVVETTLKNLAEMIDLNTVIGNEITYEDGDKVIPISKLTLGYLSGGGEYGKTTFFKKSEDLPFSAGNGAVVSVKPCGFLIKKSNGEYNILSVSAEPYERIVDKAADFIINLKENDKN